ncbi:HAD family hydrolase [Tychonema sp. LEGE 07199]|uniref:HAD family hydrolase n=1 Tax=unclassified Tychonema TaxID=2642144 RepID=UPI0018827840|nr:MULTISPECIES: HAD family hydrolase [unclassified Tychonema]MBE9121427.1 HAD family hydrolase [Tychonema sp. LEGE 07199]MBE9134645.1 HAD family hydrolase [Tychonema sp. LEGE 07196]
MKLQAVILDVDGTLVLSNNAHAQAWVEAFAAFGYDVPFDKIRPLIGMGGDKLIPKMVSGLSEEEGDGKKIAQRRKELIINRFSSTLAPAPGSRELVLKMQQEKLRLIIATSATADELSGLLKAAQVDDLLDEATTSSDVEASKPEPDIVEAALSKLQVEASKVVMLADTPYDIEAASKCGVPLIAFRCGGFDDASLAGAAEIYDSPADLLAHYQDSILGEKHLSAS